MRFFTLNMENIWPIFPHNGKTFRRFSTQWKEFVHTVENSDFRLFSGVFGLFSGAVERSARGSLSAVERAGRLFLVPTRNLLISDGDFRG